jgi:hypothetical protein
MKLVDNLEFKTTLGEIQDLNTKFQQNPTFTSLLDYIVNHSYNVDDNSEILVKSDIDRIGYLISFLHHVSHEYRMCLKVRELIFCLKNIENELPEIFPDEPERMPNDCPGTPRRQLRRR